MCDTSLYTKHTTFHLNVTEHPSMSSPDGLVGK